MPGIAAVITKTLGKSSTSILNTIVNQMFEYDNYKISSHEHGDISLKILNLDKDYHGILQTSKGLIAWYGRPFYKGNPVSKENVDELMQSLSKSDYNNLTGHFQIVYHSYIDDEFIIVSDKVSSVPIYYLNFKNSIIITPEPLSLKALCEVGWKPVIRQGAIFEFLGSGHLWGDGTFWEDVHKLGPGKYLTYKDNQIKIKTYWEMNYESSKKSISSLQSELFNAIIEDLKYIPQGKTILTLSGGFDSRALLGLLKKNPNMKFDTISYSFGENFTKSDSDVAKYYANKLGAVHHFHEASLTNMAQLIENIENTVVATGGESDTSVAQDSFLGASFYKKLADDYDFMLRGDEVWGWGDHVINEKMAFIQSLLLNLNEIPQPQKILKSHKYREAIKYIEQKRKLYQGEYPTDDFNPDDLKDYLYWKHREARLIQNMRYYRNLYISQFTPFTLDKTIEYIKTIPSKYRVRKLCFIETMKINYPELFLDDIKPTPYLNYENRFEIIFQNKQFQSYINDCLLVNPPKSLESIVNPINLRSWITNIFYKDDLPIQKKQYNLVRYANDLLSKNQYIASYLKAIIVNRGLIKFPAQDENYLFRILVLALALRQYENIKVEIQN